MAIVLVGIGGVSSGLPLGPYCPMKDPSSVKRPEINDKLIIVLNCITYYEYVKKYDS